MNKNSNLSLRLADYKEKGLYLFFDDGKTLALTERVIEDISRKLWDDTTLIPPAVRDAADFKLCPFCPEKNNEGLCYALRPVLPFLDIIDSFSSYDRVTAIYRGDEALFHVAESTMQEALQFISILSLIRYCRIGRKYRKYYVDLIPIAGYEATNKRMYLNIYWIHKGDMPAINKIIDQFKKEITESSANQVKRLNLICKSDAFMNAFYHTQIAAEFLSMDMERVLANTFSIADEK